MLHSLRFRLFLTMSIVVLVAVGTLALFTNRSTTNAFQNYVERGLEREQAFIESLLASYKGGQDTSNLQSAAKQMAQATGDRVIVARGDGRVLADSDDELVGQMLPWPLPAEKPFGGVAGAAGVTANVPVTAPVPGADVIEGMPFFMVRLEPAPGPAQGIGVGGPLPGDLMIIRVPRADSSEAGFLNSVNRSLLLSVAVAGLVALLLTLLLSRRILAPVEALTAAARKMEKGDLSQRVKVDTRDEIGELAHAFNAMADGLARLEKLRRNMVTDVAHELRTPLTNIRGYLEAMQDGAARPDGAMIDSLHEEAMLLSRLVDDLQDLELAEAGRLKLERRPIDIGEVIGKAINAQQPSAGAKGLALNADVPPDLPEVEADPGRIGQALRNLLSNAITHTPPGGEIEVSARSRGEEIEVSARSRGEEIEVSARSRGEEIEVSVRDTGEGIAPEHLPNVFDRFYRADPSRSRVTGGAGLGLAIVRQLIEMHGGRVRAESTAGEGSVFSFTLPVETHGNASLRSQQEEIGGGIEETKP